MSAATGGKIKTHLGNRMMVFGEVQCMCGSSDSSVTTKAQPFGPGVSVVITNCQIDPIIKASIDRRIAEIMAPWRK